MNTEHRAMPGLEVRDVDEVKREVLSTVLTYGVADWFGTKWSPGVFAESLRAKRPSVVWGHDSRDVIGRVVDYQDLPDHLEVRSKFSEFDAVPRAKQAFVQLRDGDITDWSFGFERQAWENITDEEQPDTTELMTRAKLVEVSPVLEAAGKGTATLDVRGIEDMSLGTIVREVIRVLDIRSLAEPKVEEPVGTVDDEAPAILGEVEGEDEGAEQELEQEQEPEPEQETPDYSELDAEIDATLAELKQ